MSDEKKIFYITFNKKTGKVEIIGAVDYSNDNFSSVPIDLTERFYDGFMDIVFARQRIYHDYKKTSFVKRFIDAVNVIRGKHAVLTLDEKLPERKYEEE